MSPPSFSDIGKAARDLIRKNFDLGLRFVSYKGKISSFEFTGRVDNAFRVGKMLGSFESKYEFKEYGLKIKEKLSSKGLLSAEASVTDQLMDGLKNTLKANYDTLSESSLVSVKSHYKKDYVNTAVDLKFRRPVPDVTQSLVFAYLDYLVGVDMNYNTFTKELSYTDFAFAYSVHDFGFHGIITNWAHTFTAGIYQRLNDRLEYAAEATWNRELPDHSWAIACKFAADPEHKHIFKAKLDSLQRISLSLRSKIAEGVKTTVSCMFNHIEEMQVGFGIEIER